MHMENHQPLTRSQTFSTWNSRNCLDSTQLPTSVGVALGRSRSCSSCWRRKHFTFLQPATVQRTLLPILHFSQRCRRRLKGALMAADGSSKAICEPFCKAAEDLALVRAWMSTTELVALRSCNIYWERAAVAFRTQLEAVSERTGLSCIHAGRCYSAFCGSIWQWTSRTVPPSHSEKPRSKHRRA